MSSITRIINELKLTYGKRHEIIVSQLFRLSEITDFNNVENSLNDLIGDIVVLIENKEIEYKKRVLPQ